MLCSPISMVGQLIGHEWKIQYIAILKPAYKNVEPPAYKMEIYKNQ